MSQPLEHSTVVELTRARSGQTAVCQIADMGASVINVEAFFFSSRRRHTRSLRDWSSDVSSSDLVNPPPASDSGFGAGMIIGIILLILIVLVLIFYAGPQIFGGGTTPRSLIDPLSSAVLA